MNSPASGQERSLLRTEAEARRALLDVCSYDVALDLLGADSPDASTFASRTAIVLESQGGTTFLDVKPVALTSVHLDGRPLDVADLLGGRFPLVLPAGRHEVVVEARMAYRRDGEGLHRSVDAADGRVYLYGMSFMDAAPSIFACFDQPDLKAPYTLHVDAPEDWSVVGNGSATRVGPTRWELAATEPLSTYVVTLVAGPYHRLHAEHDQIALGLSARASLAGALEREAEELFTLTRQSFDELHRLFGIRYPFGDYHQAFVPEFNAGAMENPGCVTFRDQMLFEDRVTRSARVNRATTVAHEMAHQWFGNLVTPRWWDDLWLNESFAEYLGVRVAAEATTYSDAWAWTSFSRRQWGLSADQRPSTHPVAGNGAADAVSALQDFDGISYAKGSAVLKQLVARVGDAVFLGGVVDHMRRHRFGNATAHDLVASWERAGAGDLGAFTADWLGTAGLDTLVADRAAGGVRRCAPGEAGSTVATGAGDPVAREHALAVALGDAGGWRTEPLHVASALTPVDLAPRGGDRDEALAVVLDPAEQTWAASCADDATVRRLVTTPALSPDAAGPVLRSAIWNNVRSAFRAARLDPAGVVDLAVASPPLEDLGDGGARVAPWTLSTLLPLAPAGSGARLHGALRAVLQGAEAGSDRQLQALRGAVRTAEDPALLRAWLAGDVPAGVESDPDLRWRVLARLAALGQTDREELDAALAARPTSTARLEHLRATASLPQVAAKEAAWALFTGEVEASNHEIEAAGAGLWQTGQQSLTAPFVARYVQDLPATAEVRSGWLLALSAASFFPATHVDESTLVQVRELGAHPGVPPAVQRRVVDATDDLERRLAVARAYPQEQA